MLFSVVLAPFYILTHSAQGFQFLQILPKTCYFLFTLYSSHPDGCEVASRCDLTFFP